MANPVQRVLALVGSTITEYVAAQVGAGTSSAGQLVALNANGYVDTTMINLSTLNPSTLPTTLPSTTGVLWNDNGVVSVS